MIAGAAAADCSRRRASRARRRALAALVSNAIVIDGLGGLNDPYSPDDQLRLSDRGWAEYRATGLTVVRDTMLPVGNHADSWEQFQKSLDQYHAYFAANPDRLKLIEKAADIFACKREGKLGVILGTQDTAMVGPALDRLAEMKKGGVRAVQLTYNLAQPERRRIDRAAQLGAHEPRPGHDPPRSKREAAARPRSWRRPHDR